jgi:1-acyl-sn-glycerol-3-phosphate acyltransferase
MTETATPPPAVDWRDALTWYTHETLACKAIKAVGGVYFKTVAAVECVDFEYIPTTGPCIIASNHASYLDICYLILYLPRHPHFMAKVELFKNPIMAWGARMCGSFPVYRGENDAWAMRQAAHILKDEQSLCIFPEGTRSKGKGELARGKVGAVKLALDYQVPLVPVAIAGTHDFKLKGWRGHKIRIQAAKPLDLVRPVGSPRDQIQALRELTDSLMRQIAQMLPPGQRGVYS